ncbi:hypothetical protein BLAT2472_80065 [Burkholderia latens]
MRNRDFFLFCKISGVLIDNGFAYQLTYYIFVLWMVFVGFGAYL